MNNSELICKIINRLEALKGNDSQIIGSALKVIYGMVIRL